MKDEQIIELLKKYSSGELTSEEKSALESWYLHQANEMPQSDPDIDKIQENLNLIAEKLPLKHDKTSVRLLWPGIAAAIALAFIFFGGYLRSDKNSSVPKVVTVKNDIVPGGNKATLTLANGKKILLSDVDNGIIAEQSGLKVMKLKNGQVIYKAGDVAKVGDKGSVEWNTITTPKGGQWEVILPDNSKVWLNSGSSLNFPEQFSGNKRIVKLKGEAYFEVSHNGKMPFHVISDRQDVEVLGTHFNITDYPDDLNVKTTLLEGSVKISNSSKSINKILKPNEQAKLIGAELTISKIDAADAIAWKEGVFLFDNDNLDEVMKKISRWYNVDVEFKDDMLKNERFSGSVSRFSRISQVLGKLEALGGVSFLVKSDKVIITKK